MFHAQFHSHYWQKSIHANVYINPTLFTPWRLLFSCSMYQFLLHLHHFLALKWGQDRITNSCKTLQHHHILQGDIFLTLGAQKGICLRTQLLNNPKHMFSTQVLHSKKWKHVFWGCWEVVSWDKYLFVTLRWEKKHLGGCDGVGEFSNSSWSRLHPISKLGNDKSGEEIDTYDRKTNYKE